MEMHSFIKLPLESVTRNVPCSKLAQVIGAELNIEQAESVLLQVGLSL